MKKKISLLVISVLACRIVSACPACEQLQPKITQGLVHGSIPNSKWDFVIVSVIAAITLFTFIFSLKYLIKPGEKNNDHIKQVILSF